MRHEGAKAARVDWEPSVSNSTFYSYLESQRISFQSTGYPPFSTRDTHRDSSILCFRQVILACVPTARKQLQSICGHRLSIPQKSLPLWGWVEEMLCVLQLAPAVTGTRKYLPHGIGMSKIFKDFTQNLALSRYSVDADSHRPSGRFSLVHGYSSQQNPVLLASLESRLNVEKTGDTSSGSAPVQSRESYQLSSLRSELKSEAKEGKIFPFLILAEFLSY